MRAPGGLEVIKAAMPKLERRHSEHLRIYDPNGGQDNLRRLSGRHETSSVEKFTWGIANRGCSVRIPRQVAEEGMVSKSNKFIDVIILIFRAIWKIVDHHLTLIHIA